MAYIKPFQAWYYHPQRVAIERVVAPPYDVISHEEARLLHAKDPHNVIRLILGRADTQDLESDDRYRQARNFLDLWTREGILSHESKAGYYLLETLYEHPSLGKKLSRLAFFALLRLEPFERKIVFAHEQTHESPKLDRGKLLRATGANFSPVFALHEESTHVVDEVRAGCEARAPLFEFTEGESSRHRLWFLDGPSELDRLSQTLDRKRVFIADGHHRYETALKYADEMNAISKKAGEKAWDYVLTSFVRFEDPGLLILPIHRLVLNSVVVDAAEIKTRLKKHFVLHPVSRSVLEKVSEGSITEGFGFALSEQECYLMELKDRTTARQLMPDGKPQSWYDLDVNLVSYLVFEPLLGIGERTLERDLDYTNSVSEVFDKLKNKKAVCSFVLRPMKAQMIKEICEWGELMPQKSTFFYPKFPSGLLIYRH